MKRSFEKTDTKLIKSEGQMTPMLDPLTSLAHSLFWSSCVMPAAKKLKLFVSKALFPKNNLLRCFRPAEKGSCGGESEASSG